MGVVFTSKGCGVSRCVGKLLGTRCLWGGRGMFSESLDACSSVLRLRGRLRPESIRCWNASSSSESSPSSSLSSDASPTPLKSAQTHPRGDSRRISPHSWRSFIPEPARNMMRVGV